MDVLPEVWQHLQSGPVPRLDAWRLALLLGIAAAAVLLTPVWRVLRLGVTLVHELGHAGVGVLCGRRFTGFVVRGDMSGHAVTAGPARGPGRVATAWAGYPAPALLGAGLVLVAVRGWAAPTLAVTVLLLVLALTRVRSVLTAVVVVAAAAATGTLWWVGTPILRAEVVLVAGVVLLAGAWRHLGAVWSGGGPGSDPGVMARLTGVPVLVWLLSYAVVLAAASWLVADQLSTAGGWPDLLPRP